MKQAKEIGANLENCELQYYLKCFQYRKNHLCEHGQYSRQRTRFRYYYHVPITKLSCLCYWIFTFLHWRAAHSTELDRIQVTLLSNDLMVVDSILDSTRSYFGLGEGVLFCLAEVLGKRFRGSGRRKLRIEYIAAGQPEIWWMVLPCRRPFTGLALLAFLQFNSPRRY